jgi:hypothetical protein
LVVIPVSALLLILCVFVGFMMIFVIDFFVVWGVFLCLVFCLCWVCGIFCFDGEMPLFYDNFAMDWQDLYLCMYGIAVSRT